MSFQQNKKKQLSANSPIASYIASTGKIQDYFTFYYNDTSQPVDWRFDSKPRLWEHECPIVPAASHWDLSHLPTHHVPLSVLSLLLELGKLTAVMDRYEDLPHKEAGKADEDDPQDHPQDNEPNVDRLRTLCDTKDTS